MSRRGSRGWCRRVAALRSEPAERQGWSLQTERGKAKEPPASAYGGSFAEIGAGNETRTRDHYLGKVVLYQLSYARTLNEDRE